ALVSLSFAAVFVVAAVGGVLVVRLLVERRLFASPASLAILLWCFAAIVIAVFGATRAELVRGSFDGGRFLGVNGSSPLHAVNVMGTLIVTAIGLPQERPFDQLAKVAVLCCVAGTIALLRR